MTSKATIQILVWRMPGEEHEEGICKKYAFFT